jgi:hypothetical protein
VVCNYLLATGQAAVNFHLATNNEKHKYDKHGDPVLADEGGGFQIGCGWWMQTAYIK